ncbi:hypothetical protein [Acidisoma sp. L85]|uniref:hypothetical protein n=1 Tax=Acidisoma sp. L85 TaxID=1641850 RepID=UPI00131E3B04|nr:hypothetical protein [Acidisoma sp. L85]
MNADPRRVVRFAEVTLWTWTGWETASGIYQSWTSVPKLAANQLSGLIFVTPWTIHELIVAFYVIGACLSAWIIWQIGAGKRWARSSLLLSLLADAIWTAAPPYNNIPGYMWAIPDLGPQVAATYLLYFHPGRLWFEEGLTPRGYRRERGAIGPRKEL